MSATHFDLMDFGLGSGAKQYYIESVNVVNQYLVDIKFHGQEKPFMLGGDNLNVIVDAFGDDIGFWLGQAIWLKRRMATKEEKDINPVIVGFLDVHIAKPARAS